MSEMANITDPALASVGLDQISWAEQFMPALADATTDLKRSKIMSGRKVGVVLALDAKTAVLARSLAKAGAEVSVYCDGKRAADPVAAALASEGLRIFARSDADAAMESILLERFVDQHVEFLIDDGARCTQHIHSNRRDALQSLVGVAEQTAAGLRPVRAMEVEGTLEVPCLAIDDARTKQLFDNSGGAGQSVVMSVVDVTNIQLQGKTVVVVGYGATGRGVAHAAHALGAQVVVAEIDPIPALQAAYDGYRLELLESACAVGDVFITATGVGQSLTSEHAKLMKDGAILAVGGAGQAEIDLNLGGIVQAEEQVREHVRRVSINEVRSVFLIADGHRSNTATGEGDPIEIMDLSLAVHCRAVQFLADHEGELAPGVHDVPPAIDEAVARSALGSLGFQVD